jgi:hypothetical protein
MTQPKKCDCKKCAWNTDRETVNHMCWLGYPTSTPVHSLIPRWKGKEKSAAMIGCIYFYPMPLLLCPHHTRDCLYKSRDGIHCSKGSLMNFADCMTLKGTGKQEFDFAFGDGEHDKLWDWVRRSACWEIHRFDDYDYVVKKVIGEGCNLPPCRDIKGKSSKRR